MTIGRNTRSHLETLRDLQGDRSANVGTRQCANEPLATSSTYHPTRPFTTATELRRIERLATFGRRIGFKTVRAFDAWLVNLIVRRSLQDTIGENVPVILYAKSGQPAHAATEAAKLWERVARRGVPEFEPWPATDQECPVERLDDNDFDAILRDAMRPKRIETLYTAGHPEDPWAFMVGDPDMAIELLSNLKNTGPTYGGCIQDDLDISLGGRGFEVEASMDAQVVDRHSSEDD